MHSTLPDHDDVLGRTADPRPAETAARAIYGYIAGMRWHSRVLIALAAALIRRIVLHWPGLTGSIACAQVWAELEAATERHEACVSLETPARLARPC